MHRLAILAAAPAVLALLVVAVPQDSPLLTASLLIYGASLLAMLISSAQYNRATTPRTKALLRRVDHAAIFVMIAGTYTPFLAMRMPEPWGEWLLVYVWGLACLGVSLKVLWIDRFARLSVALYLFLGWTVVVAFEPLAGSVETSALVLLALGGILYSVGVVFHLWERLPYQQPIWHGFVVAAAACHYVAILGGVALPERLS